MSPKRFPGFVKTDRLYIEEPKTDNGLRDVPVTPDVEEAFRNAIKNRPVANEIIVWDELHQVFATGFIWIDKDGNYEDASDDNGAFGYNLYFKKKPANGRYLEQIYSYMRRYEKW